MFDTCQRHEIDKKWHEIDKNNMWLTYHRQKLWNFTSTWRRHRFLCRHNVYINFRGFCRFLSFFVDGMLIWCRFWSSACWVYVDDIKRHVSTSYRHRFLCRHDVDKKVDKNRPKPTKIDQNWQKVDKNRPKFVDIMSTNDIRPTPERQKGHVQHVSFFGRFWWTSCRQNDNFLSIFGRFLLIFVDFGRQKVDQNRQKTRVEHVFDTCRRRFVDTMSTKRGRHIHHVPK